MHTYLTVKQQDGSIWGVPVDQIARHRATHYASEFGGDVERSLAEDTVPLFEADEFEIADWAVNQMNWSDFTATVRLAGPPPNDFQAAWLSGDKGYAS